MYRYNYDNVFYQFQNDGQDKDTLVQGRKLKYQFILENSRNNILLFYSATD